MYKSEEGHPPKYIWVHYDLGIVAAEGVSKCDFFKCRDVACRVSMFPTTYKTFNINNLSNQIVETQNFASLLLHWNDNFDAPSTIGLDKLLIFNAICAIINVETQRATFLQHQYRNFDTPSLTRQKTVLHGRHATRVYQNCEICRKRAQ